MTKPTEMLSPGVAKVHLCLPCADKLRAIRDANGVIAMTRAMGATLCEDCKGRIPGWAHGQTLIVEPKR